VRAFAAAALLLLAAHPAWAHGRSTSYSTWEIEQPAEAEEAAATAEVRVQAAWLDLQRALPRLAPWGIEVLTLRADLAREANDYLAAHYALLVDGTPCTPGVVQAAPTADPTHLARRWPIACPRPGSLTVRATGFLDAVPTHLHLARVRAGDAPPVQRVFVLGSPELALASGTNAAPASSIAEFVRIGIEHIVSGYDHLAFLLALLLLGSSLAEIATVVTGFTVAHSVTLALGVLGVVQPHAATVEALIGLSIAVVALENAALTMTARGRRAIGAALALGLGASALAATAGLLTVPASALVGVGLFSLCYLALLPRVERPFRLRWLLAFAFGLIHGFGFAGVLVEMDLPRAGLARALFGFNVGVEMGQLALVAVAWPILRAVTSGPPARRRLVVQVGSAAVLAAGLFWFASRAAADPPSDAFRRTVQLAEQSRYAAMIKNNLSALDAMLADDLLFTHASGAVEDKTAFLASLQSGALRYRRIETSEERVRRFGDTAIVTGRSDLTIEVNGRPRTLRLRTTAVLVRGENGRFRPVSYQSTAVPDEGG
jgi:ketosteroid isomerase-like protein